VETCLHNFWVGLNFNPPDLVTTTLGAVWVWGNRSKPKEKKASPLGMSPKEKYDRRELLCFFSEEKPNSFYHFYGSALVRPENG
jgi:hypothetical protein